MPTSRTWRRHCRPRCRTGHRSALSAAIRSVRASTRSAGTPSRPPADAPPPAACTATRMHGGGTCRAVIGRCGARLAAPAGRYDMNAIGKIAARFATPLVHWIALLGLCAAYLQGGIVKATDFSGAIAEMEHFGLAPAVPLAIAVIVLELGASVMILTGFYRWLAA